MWLPGVLALLALVVSPLVSAQSSQSANTTASTTSNSTADVTVITSLTTIQGLGPGRVPTSSVQTLLITSTIQPAGPTSSPPASNSSSASTQPSSTTTANLPTGTAAVVSDQAPSPGATGGAYGPGDNYISAAISLQRSSALLVGGLAVVVGFLAV
ncbi:hypothetical protein C8R45DRAFT_952985 [Mycena sanguinolenta]|nr:hypothetical protein C8R45DRAFT_952985 [Mycena sanguinolenta]